MLADPIRRQLLDRLRARNGQTLNERREGQAVRKHPEILEDANLVTRLTRGREKPHNLNAVRIHETAERWIGKRERLRAPRGLNRDLDGETDS